MMAAAWLFQHQLPTTGPSEKGLAPQAQGEGFSGCFLGGGGLGTLHDGDSVLSPTWGEGMKGSPRTPFSCPSTE